MALTEGDKAECKEIAREIVKEVLVEHINSCPIGKTLMKNRMLLIGIVIGSTLAGGGAGIGIANLLMRVNP